MSDKNMSAADLAKFTESGKSDMERLQLAALKICADFGSVTADDLRMMPLAGSKKQIFGVVLQQLKKKGIMVVTATQPTTQKSSNGRSINVYGLAKDWRSTWLQKTSLPVPNDLINLSTPSVADDKQMSQEEVFERLGKVHALAVKGTEEKVPDDMAELFEQIVQLTAPWGTAAHQPLLDKTIHIPDVSTLPKAETVWPAPKMTLVAPESITIPDMSTKMKDLNNPGSKGFEQLIFVGVDHSQHGLTEGGKRTPNMPPMDSDCVCRGSPHQKECAKAGCGFCRASDSGLPMAQYSAVFLSAEEEELDESTPDDPLGIKPESKKEAVYVDMDDMPGSKKEAVTDFYDNTSGSQSLVEMLLPKKTSDVIFEEIPAPTFTRLFVVFRSAKFGNKWVWEERTKTGESMRGSAIGWVDRQFAIDHLKSNVSDLSEKEEILILSTKHYIRVCPDAQPGLWLWSEHKKEKITESFGGFATKADAIVDALKHNPGLNRNDLRVE